MMPLFNEEGFTHSDVYEKLSATGELKGAEAIAYILGQISNATHGNYCPQLLFERVNWGKLESIKINDSLE